MEVSVHEAFMLARHYWLPSQGIAGLGVRDGCTLVVYVESEDAATRVPETLAGHSVETRVVGRLVALSTRYALQFWPGRVRAAAERRDERWRPAPGGVSIGHYLITAGTLGCRVYDNLTGARMILSNNHVLANVNNAKLGDPILQPGPYDGGRVDRDTIARLTRFVELRPNGNLVDAAIARPLRDDYLSDTILGLGVVKDVRDPVVGLVVSKSGRTTGVTSGRVSDVSASVKVWYSDDVYFLFDDQCLTDGPIGQPGDSGSVIVDGAMNAVGLLFAGSPLTTVFNRALHVENQLNIQFVRVPGVPVKGVSPLVPIAAGAAVIGLSAMLRDVWRRRGRELYA